MDDQSSRPLQTVLLQSVLRAREFADSGGIKRGQGRKERHLDHSGRTPDLDCAVDGGAVAYLWDGHAKQVGGAGQPVLDRLIQRRAGADDRDRRRLLQLFGVPFTGQRRGLY